MTTRLESLKSWLQTIFVNREYRLESASADASFRCYYRITIDEKSWIAMDAPPPQEDCAPFININKRLIDAGVNAPEIIHQNLSDGFLLLSDLGDKHYLSVLNETNALKLYQDAIRALVKMQNNTRTNALPAYAADLLRAEIDLFHDWLLTKHLQINPTHYANNREQLTESLIDNAIGQPQLFVHRDYHSRNLMLTNSSNPGVIDFQDAIIGPISYDLVSLLKDCYISWPGEFIQGLINYYLQELGHRMSSFSATQFQAWFDLMGVQRHLKASGIFARLYHRDGKAAYLKDIPRTLNYISALRDDYVELATLCDLLDEHVLPALDAMQ